MTKYIYVIAPVNTDKPPCKIGISDNPDKRVKQLQTGHPEKLEVKYLLEVNNAEFYERLLHKDIKHKRKTGEWFDLTVKEAIDQIGFTMIHYQESELTF